MSSEREAQQKLTNREVELEDVHGCLGLHELHEGKELLWVGEYVDELKLKRLKIANI